MPSLSPVVTFFVTWSILLALWHYAGAPWLLLLGIFGLATAGEWMRRALLGLHAEAPPADIDASLQPPPQDNARTVVGDIDGVLRQLREEIH